MPEENNILQQIKDIYYKQEPLMQASAKEVSQVEETAMSDFKKAQVIIKEALIKDKSISGEELEEVYLSKLKEIKEEIQRRAEIEFEEIKNKYTK